MFPPYSKTRDSGVEWLGKVPEHWESARLKFLAGLNMGQSPSSEECNLDGVGVPFLQGNAEFGPEYPTPRQYCPSARKHACPDDILLSVRAPVGALNVADQVYGIGRGLCAITPSDKFLDQRFAIYLLYVIKTELDSVATGSTYQAVSVEQVASIHATAPPLSEQRTIASFLDRKTALIDDLVAKRKRQIELLQEQRTALISRAVTKGLNPDVPMKDSGVEWLGEVPEHWGVIPLKWRARCSSGDSLQVDDVTPVPEIGRQTPAIGGNGVMGYTDKVNIVTPVLVIGRVGALCGNVHRISPPAWVTDNALILDADSRVFEYSYLHAVLLSRNLNNLAAKTAQPLITGSQVRDQRLPCPPLSEQLAITSFLDRETAKIDTFVAKVQLSIEKLKEYRQSLISAVVTGKIDVRGHAAYGTSLEVPA